MNTPNYAERVKPIWERFSSIQKNVFMPNKEFIDELKAQIKKTINKAYKDGFNAGLNESKRLERERKLDEEF